MQIVSIVTGKVRQEARALEMVKSLVMLRSMGVTDAIVFSTWVAELNEYPELRAFVLSNDITVIENKIQTFTIHEAHQKIPLLAALNIVSPDCFVTRHRTDRILPSEKFKNFLYRIKIDGMSNLNVSEVNSKLKGKIVVGSVLVDVPFFINDMIFSGYAQDISRLAKIDAQQTLSWSSFVNGEFSFYAGLFFDQFPLIGEYLSVYPGLFYGYIDRKVGLRKINERSDFYLRVLSLYYLILSKYFCIGYECDDSQVSCEPLNFDELVMGDPTGFLDLFEYRLSGHWAARSGRVFRECLAGNLVESDLSRRFLQQMRDLQDVPPVGISGMPQLSQSGADYAMQLMNSGFHREIPPGLTVVNGSVFQYYTGALAARDAAGKSMSVGLDMGEWETI